MRVGLLLASPALFVLACCLPALEWSHSQGPNDVMWGASALAVGWSGIFALVVPWYANPVWVLGVLFGFLKMSKAGAVAGVIACLIAASIFPVIGRDLPGDEGGVTHTSIVRLLPGCYVWLLSLVVLPVVCLLTKRRV